MSADVLLSLAVLDASMRFGVRYSGHPFIWDRSAGRFVLNPDFDGGATP